MSGDILEQEKDERGRASRQHSQKSMRLMCLSEAVRIGDELLSRAEPDEHGFSWRTMVIDRNYRLAWRKSPDIYSGATGIALFLLELYRQTAQVKYLDAARQAINWAEHFSLTQRTNNYTFFTGRTGVCYGLTKLYEATSESHYLEKALRLARPCAEHLDSIGASHDLLEGAAGVAIGLLHLHAATGDEGVLRALELCLSWLVNGAQAGRKGLYWDRSPLRIRGLCGMAHGASGIGLVLLEAGNYFNSEALCWLAEQAFLYEAQCYDEAMMNWPDFRLKLARPKGQRGRAQASVEGDPDALIKGRDMNAWCHGAVGIGLVRLRALQLLDKPHYLDEAKAALAKTKATDIVSNYQGRSFTLCHGCGGAAELFLEADKRLDEPEYASAAETIASQALKLRADDKAYLSGLPEAGTQEDASLFLGNAGIGYLFLRLLDPLRTPSLLLPSLRNDDENRADLNPLSSAYSLATVRASVINKSFRRTLCIAARLAPEQLANYLAQGRTADREDEKERFIVWVQSLIGASEAREQRCLADVFSLEWERIRLDDAIKSNYLMHVRKLTQLKRAGALVKKRERQLLGLKLKLDSEVKIKLTEWNWSAASETEWLNNLVEEPGTYMNLLRPSAEGIIEESISDFSFTVLRSFEEKKQIGKVVRETIELFEPVNSTEREAIKEAVIEQIRNALAAAILLPSR